VNFAEGLKGVCYSVGFVGNVMPSVERGESQRKTCFFHGHYFVEPKSFSNSHICRPLSSNRDSMQKPMGAIASVMSAKAC
jgi:hypothetical protein